MSGPWQKWRCGRRCRGRRGAQADGGVALGGEPVDLGEFGVRGGEADLESFGFADPAFSPGFVDAGDQVVADARKTGPLIWGNPEKGTSDATVLMNAAGPVGSSAVAQGDSAAFEMAEELLPFLVGGSAVFL